MTKTGSVNSREFTGSDHSQAGSGALYESHESVVRGVVERVTYRNQENGYSVLRLEVHGESSAVTIVGNCLNVEVGTHLIARGVFTQHPKFGRQLTARTVTITTPSTPEEIERYLGSGLIKGVGEATAAKIVDQFGAETIEVLLQDPDRVAKVPGVGKHRAQLLADSIRAQKDSGEVLRFLVEHGIAVNLATRIYQRYESRTVELINKDPYRLAREMRGVGFLTADRIALQLGVDATSLVRLRAALLYALEKSADDGHTYLPVDNLILKTRALLKIDDSIDLTCALESVTAEKLVVVREENKIFLVHLDLAESVVSKFVAARAEPRQFPLMTKQTVSKALAVAAQELAIEFSAEQVEAVQAAVDFKLLLITGGPGCGKTTVIRALAELFRASGKRLLMAAPTGRAAQRMAQVCGMSASTIHRLLRYDPLSGRFLHGISNPLECDGIIIDESSMCDVALARDLFQAIPKDATLILVGDKDQLPSVGPGRVFAELLSLHELKTITLSRLFRRGEESQINSVAHAVNSGTVPAIPEPDGVTKSDAYFIVRHDPEEIASVVQRLVTEQIPKKFNIPAEQIAVLTPTNRGPLGTVALNQRLQAALNPPDPSFKLGDRFIVDDYEIRTGDRVCQRVNNYQIDDSGVFNGDVGIVTATDPGAGTVTVELWDGRIITYTNATLKQLSLAYAVTVHRSQGSEFPCVVLVLHEAQFMLLERQLIYTAITRAKQLLIIVGSRAGLATACKRKSGSRRLTMLAERVRVELGASDRNSAEDQRRY